MKSSFTRNYAKLLVYRFPPIAILGARPPLDARAPVTQRHINFRRHLSGTPVVYVWRTGNTATAAPARKEERNILGLPRDPQVKKKMNTV